MPLADVHDLTELLASRRAYESAVAGGPVRFVTREFVAALQGAWGDVEVTEPPRTPAQRVASE